VTDATLRCALCHEAFGDAPPTPCPGCQTLLHADCAARLGRCPTLGCARGATAAPVEKKVAPSYALYSPNQVLLAAILAAFPGGLALMALNAWRLGRRSTSLALMVLAYAGTVAFGFAMIHLPERAADRGRILALLIAFALRQATVIAQGCAFGEHLAAGGRRGSWLAAVGLAVVAAFTVIFTSAVGFSLVFDDAP
jgi:hypothetical protein